MKSHILSCVLLFFITILFSCNSNTGDKSDDLLIKYREGRDSITAKYNAIPVRDTSINRYTYLYQNKLISEKHLLAFTGSVSDIIKQDNNYIMIVTNDDVYDKFTARVVVDSSKTEDLKRYFESRKRIIGCFILKVTKIIPVGPALELDYHEGEAGSEDDEGTDPYISLGEFGDEKILIFKSTLIDYYLRKY